MYRLLIINPGSTSTKVGVYEDEKPLFIESVAHDAEKLKEFEYMADQFEFRKELVLKCLEEHEFDIKTLDAIVARGGLIAMIEAGAYEVNDDMLWQLKNRPQHEHPSNLGGLIARSIGDSLGIPSYIYDGITVDELLPINKITGRPEMNRKGMGHNLNTRAVAHKYANDIGKKYEELTLIVCHIGGGCSVNLHHNGKIEDFVNDEVGAFSPERAGCLPIFDLINLCYSGKYTHHEMMTFNKRGGGLLAHLGTTDSRKVEEMIENGDEHAALVYDAMALNLSKDIATCAVGVKGKVDAILLTGGIAHSKRVTGYIEEHTSWIAPVKIYPGEDEMESLAMGGLRVLRGEEKAKIYIKDENL